MVRFDSKTAISTINGTEIIPITDDDSVDKKITLNQIKTFTNTGIDLSGKQNLITSPTNNHVVLTNGSGQTIDSGIASTALTTQGNTFNGVSQLVQTDSSGKLPAIDGSLLTGVGGSLKLDARGIISSGTTLLTNYVTTAHISATLAITLPTTLSAGVENIVVLDFTTSSASQPTIVSTNPLKWSKNNGGVPPSAYSNLTSGAKTITGATNANPIEITSASHGYVTGDVVTVASVGGNTNANGTWIVTKTGTNTYTLNGSNGNATYTSGGTSTHYPVKNLLIFKTHDGGINWEAEYTYYGGIEVAFTRPNISSDGTMGGTTFAVRHNKVATNALYLAFDGSAGTWCYLAAAPVSSGNIDMYYPEPFKVTTFYSDSYSGDVQIAAGTLYASNDDSTYVSLGAFTMTIIDAGHGYFNVGSPNFYKYYRISYTAMTGGYGPQLPEIRWTATKMSV